jgi:valyl-tRNA synthetase
MQYDTKYGPLTLGTVRPETKFGDTALLVHPDAAARKCSIGIDLNLGNLADIFEM